MTKQEDRKMLVETILLYKDKAQSPEVKKMIQKLQQQLDKLDDKHK